MLTKLPKLQEKGWANLNSEEKFYFATNVSFAFFLGLIFIAPNSSFVGGLCCLTLIASFVSTQVLGNVANPETIVGLNQFNEFADNAGTNMISEIDAGNNMDPQDRMVSSAMKKLETMLIDRGYTASSLLENFDTDGDGEINYDEFDNGLLRVTGAKAPESLVRAVFSAIDADNNGSISLAEFAALMGGEDVDMSETSGIEISGHSIQLYNGVYAMQPELMNGKPWFKNNSGTRLYFYNANSGGAPSWSLDNREQNGSNDWYNGGWTRSPADGRPPIGERRFIGVGKITIRPVVAQIDSSESVAPVSPVAPEAPAAPVSPEAPFAPVASVSAETETISPLDEAIQVTDSIIIDIQEALADPNTNLDELRSATDAKFEESIRGLPYSLKVPAREVWKLKVDAAFKLANIHLNPDNNAAKIAAGVGLAGAVVGGVAAAGMRDNVETATTTPEPEHESSSDWHDAHHVEVTQDVDPPERVRVPDRITLSGESSSVVEETAKHVESISVPSEPIAVSQDAQVDEVAISLNSIISEFTGARFLNDQRALVEQYSESTFNFNLRVISVDRTFGIGLKDEYRGGSTLIGTLEDDIEVEVRLMSSADASAYHNGSEIMISAEVCDWNGIRKRLILNAY
ncbi:MAG: EF-hand domain-containing protein [Euryarchaeota archaeon]|nr:EF-hand domain-containing protein [Euryarchaeota archaeon]MBT3757350.1 EF-hand domain-containing protein [Euryarchaeota archaeon]